MQYEQTGDHEHPYKLTFEGDEPEVIRAAYREHIYHLAAKGNTGSMEDYEAAISGWEADGKPKSLLPTNPENIAHVLDNFWDRTEDEIQRIPETNSVPAFQNDDIGERFRLGKMATTLAQEIREKLVYPAEQLALEEEPAAESPEATEMPDPDQFTITDDSLRRWADGGEA